MAYVNIRKLKAHVERLMHDWSTDSIMHYAEKFYQCEEYDHAVFIGIISYLEERIGYNKVEKFREKLEKA